MDVFETGSDGTGVFNVDFPITGEDALEVATRQIEARRLDANCDVACTSSNFENKRDDDRDGAEDDADDSDEGDDPFADLLKLNSPLRHGVQT